MYEKPELRFIEFDDSNPNPVMGPVCPGCCNCGGQGNVTSCAYA